MLHPAVHRRDALLLAAAAHIQHCHPDDTQLGERRLHLFQPLRTDDALDFLHTLSPAPIIARRQERRNHV